MDVIRLWGYLGLVDFPASKLEVIDVSARAGAPQGSIEFLQSLSGDRYDSPEALQVAIQERLSAPPAVYAP